MIALSPYTLQHTNHELKIRVKKFGRGVLEAKSYRFPEVNGLKNSIDRHKGQAPKRKGTEVRIYGVPQERRRTVNPLRRKTEFLANKTVKVNPQRGKTRRNPQEGISADRE